MTEASNTQSFMEKLKALRVAYNEMRDNSNFFTSKFKEFDCTKVEDALVYRIRLEDGTGDGKYVRIVDRGPGKLSGDILRLKRNIPIEIQGHFEIVGDEIRDVEPECIPLFDELEDDSQDVTEALNSSYCRS